MIFIVACKILPFIEVNMKQEFERDDYMDQMAIQLVVLIGEFTLYALITLISRDKERQYFWYYMTYVIVRLLIDLMNVLLLNHIARALGKNRKKEESLQEGGEEYEIMAMATH